MTLKMLVTYYRRANKWKAEQTQVLYQNWHPLFEKMEV